MLGVRFLDVDFMRINSACGCQTVKIIHLFCTVVKGAAAWSASRSQCRMEAPGRVRGIRRPHEPRGQPHFVLPPNLYMGPPVGGLFGFKFSFRRHPRKFGQKRFLAVRRSWRGNGVACFWATSLEEIIGGVIAIISFRPGGWMQQSAVPRCAILSVGSTGGIGQ